MHSWLKALLRSLVFHETRINSVMPFIVKKSMTVYAINPQMDMVERDRCYAGLGILPERPDAVVLIIQPPQLCRS